jgi:hypothetical protein
MNEAKRKTKVKDNAKINLAESLGQVPVQTEGSLPGKVGSAEVGRNQTAQTDEAQNENQSDESTEYQEVVKNTYSKLFDRWNDKEFAPQDSQTDVYVNSIESSVGYSSLIRQFQYDYIRTVAFHRSQGNGSVSIEEARALAFHECFNEEEAREIFNDVMSYSLENVSFNQLHTLYDYAPRVAEQFWESMKREGRAEFESGHAAANAVLPVGYMRDAWSVARYLGLRESFLDEWQPKGGIELSLIDMLAQAFFQWQYWLEQTIKRSQTREREEHPEYQKWQRQRNECYEKSWEDGYWLRPTVSEQQAIDHAVQTADRWNRIYMRTLRQLRDLRRYAPVTINNPNQVNIANDDGQQINVTGEDTKS